MTSPTRLKNPILIAMHTLDSFRSQQLAVHYSFLSSQKTAPNKVEHLIDWQSWSKAWPVLSRMELLIACAPQLPGRAGICGLQYQKRSVDQTWNSLTTMEKNVNYLYWTCSYSPCHQSEEWLLVCLLYQEGGLPWLSQVLSLLWRKHCVRSGPTTDFFVEGFQILKRHESEWAVFLVMSAPAHTHPATWWTGWCRPSGWTGGTRGCWSPCSHGGSSRRTC